MGVISLVGSKVLLAVCNFLLLACGFTLVTGGMLVLFDPERVLLSRLLSAGPLSNMPHPLLYYLALGLAGLGLILAAAGVLGCWASCMHNYYMLTTYFLIIMIVLVGECVIYATAWAWPHCLGLGMDSEDLTKTLQRNYGSVGEEQFTAAVDLAQTAFNCCGIDSSVEYDTSLWRLQALGPSLAVPLTCCKLQNINQPKAYLNPQPINASLCQALELNRHEGYRHLPGCKESLEQWYREHYIVFLAIGLTVVLIEFLVLLSTIVTCTRIYHHKQETKENAKNARTEPKTVASQPSSSSVLPPTKENFYQRSLPTAYSNETYALTNSFRQNYKLVDRA